jgi:hypothetical protein
MALGRTAAVCILFSQYRLGGGGCQSGQETARPHLARTDALVTPLGLRHFSTHCATSDPDGRHKPVIPLVTYHPSVIGQSAENNLWDSTSCFLISLFPSFFFPFPFNGSSHYLPLNFHHSPSPFRSGIRIPARARYFSLPRTSTPTLGPTRLLIG